MRSCSDFVMRVQRAGPAAVAGTVRHPSLPREQRDDDGRGRAAERAPQAEQNYQRRGLTLASSWDITDWLTDRRQFDILR
jgi:hypothetical protein